MKFSFLMLFSLSLLLSGCGNKKTANTDASSDETTTTSTTTESSATSNTNPDESAMNKKVEELKKLSPLTIDQLKALLPEELNGIKRTDFSANTAMGFAIGEAEYQKDDTTKLHLVIYDCAGEAGSAMYFTNYWGRMNLQSENSQGYTKTIDFKGDKAVETYDKSSHQHTLTYADADRLLVIITGQNMGSDAVKDAAKSLNLKI